ncbi:MAG: hypothetical protein QW680_12490 [Pyrobaculum sp.]
MAGLWDIGVDQLEYYPPPPGALATALGIHVDDNAAEALAAALATAQIVTFQSWFLFPFGIYCWCVWLFGF